LGVDAEGWGVSDGWKLKEGWLARRVGYGCM
jgi:hypothetical protein